MIDFSIIAIAVLALLIGVQFFLSALIMQHQLKRDDAMMRLQDALYDQITGAHMTKPKQLKKEKK